MPISWHNITERKDQGELRNGEAARIWSKLCPLPAFDSPPALISAMAGSRRNTRL